MTLENHTIPINFLGLCTSSIITLKYGKTQNSSLSSKQHGEENPLCAYIPFFAGHRNCIGQNFAMNEKVAVAIAIIANRFRLTMDEGHMIEMAPCVIRCAKYDILIYLEEFDV